MRTLLSLALLLAVNFSFADSSKGALIASVQGDAQVLSPGPVDNGKAMLTFEGSKYHFGKAKIGQLVKAGQIVMTATDGKVKVIYDHGDIVIVGPSSALAISDKGTKTAMNQMSLQYGKVRAIVDHDGPMTGVKIKTPVAVAGVRGTDLYVAHYLGSEQTEVQVLRGQVELSQTHKTKGVPLPKPSVIKVGEVGRVEMQKQPEVKTSTKQELAKVQEETTVTPTVAEKAEVSEPAKKAVAEAEKKAVEIIVKDVTRYDAQAGKALQDKKVSSVEDANTMVLHDVYKAAPSAPSKQKPSTKDFDNTDDVYQKYFKPLSL